MGDDISKILNLIDFTIHKIREVEEVYQKFSKKIQWIGMSKMLHSMLDMEKEHAKVLILLRQRGNLEEAFTSPAAFKKEPHHFFQQIHFVDNMNFIDFLSMVIQQQEEFVKIFTELSARAGEIEVQHLLKTLTEDARKQRLWALDRYELEILTI